MIAAILSFVASIITGVITDAFKTPAVETVVEVMFAPLPTIPTHIDELLSQYRMFDRD